jgi:hypothetical protein
MESPSRRSRSDVSGPAALLQDRMGHQVGSSAVLFILFAIPLRQVSRHSMDGSRKE